MSKKSRNTYIQEINGIRKKIMMLMILSFIGMFSMSFGFFSQQQVETVFILLGTAGLVLLVISLIVIIYLENKRKKLIDQVRKLGKGS